MGFGKKFLDLVSSSDEPNKVVPESGNSEVSLGALGGGVLPSELNTLSKSLDKFDMATILEMVEQLAQNDSYAKFQKQCQALATFIPDEVALFKAALASLQSAGVTLEQIRTDIRKRQGLLQRVELEFKQTLDVNRQLMEQCQHAVQVNAQQVKQLEAEITQLETVKQGKQKAIEQLMVGTQGHTGKVNQLQQEMAVKTEEFNKALAEVKEVWQVLLITKLSGLV